MRHIILAAVIAGVFVLSAPTTSACFCFVPDVADSYAKASDVFVGVITEIITPRPFAEKASLSDRLFTIKFKVEKSWKGRFSSEISVLADQGRLGCFSYPTVYEGEKYLVYGDPVYSDEGKAQDSVMIHACNRTGLINEQWKKPPYGYEFRDWLGRNYRTEDIKELEEITNLNLKFEFNRSHSRPRQELQPEHWWGRSIRHLRAH